MSVQGFGPFRKATKINSSRSPVVPSPIMSKTKCHESIDAEVEINVLKCERENLKFKVNNLSYDVESLRDAVSMLKETKAVLEADLINERERAEAEMHILKSNFEEKLDIVKRKYECELDVLRNSEAELKRQIQSVKRSDPINEVRISVNLIQYDDGMVELDIDSVDNATFDEVNFESLKSVVKHMYMNGAKLTSHNSSQSSSLDSGVLDVRDEFDDIDCVNVFSKVIDSVQHVSRLAGYIHRIRTSTNATNNSAAYDGLCNYIYNWKLFPKRAKKTIKVIASDMCAIGYKRLLNYYCYVKNYSSADVLEAMNISVDINSDIIDLSDMTYQVTNVEKVDLIIKVDAPNGKVGKVDDYHKKHTIGNKGMGLVHQMSHLGLKNTDLGWYHMGKTNVINESSMLCYVDDNGQIQKTRPIRRSTDDPSYVLMRRLSFIRDRVVCVEVSGGRLPIIAQLIRDDVVDDSEYYVGEQVKAAMTGYSIDDLEIASNANGSISVIIRGVEDSNTYVASNFNCCSVANRTKVRC